ncbi:DUF488 domain-containing protein [Lactococcus lactis]|uniref:DUF488 domain-containing protein n=1 Tax=Lactococcus lactis TaxID=1358 RepID=UPI002FE4CDFE
MDNRIVFTIGYAGFSSTKKFVSVLKDYDINLLIDVRSIPYSKTSPGYNRENLKEILKKERIYYQNFSKEFGAKQEYERYFSKASDISDLLKFPIAKSSRVDSEELLENDYIIDYKKFTKSNSFRDGVEKINKAYADKKKFVCVLMCSEKNPIDCHRTIMISNALKKQFTFRHILSDGTYITNDSMENNLSLWSKKQGIDVHAFDLYNDERYKITIDDCYKARNVFLGWRLPK